MDWTIADAWTELKGWGHTGGEAGNVIMKSDNETSIIAVRNATA